jgi:hypothetical protein
MTRRRQPPAERQKIFLTTALANPAIREIEAESGDAAPFSDVLQAAAFAAIAAGFALALAHGIALLLSLPGYALHYVMVGSVGFVAVVIRAGQIADARRVRQWARFDAEPQSPQTKNFVPTIDGSKTLVRDTPLRGKVAKWAVLLPSVGYSLTFARWVGKGKLFTRAEYETVRGMMQALGYMADDQLTARGRDAVGRWAAGGFRAGELHMLRGGE